MVPFLKPLFDGTHGLDGTGTGWLDRRVSAFPESTATDYPKVPVGPLCIDVSVDEIKEVPPAVEPKEGFCGGFHRVKITGNAGLVKVIKAVSGRDAPHPEIGSCFTLF